MKRHILIGLIGAMVLSAVSGCTTIGGAQAVATPWGAGGVYAFKPAKAIAPNAKRANAQVAQLLDNEESATGVMVATR